MPKLPITILAAVCAALLCARAARAAQIVHVQASRVTFYYNRFLLEADGDVRVRTSEGVTMQGDAFSMDLKLNRFVLAGHVSIQDRSGAQSGAAIADFLDYDRIYFLPIIGLRQAQPSFDKLRMTSDKGGMTSDKGGMTSDKGGMTSDKGGMTSDASGVAPDRWTFENGDFAHPLKGRVMPGDVFDLPDLGSNKPYLIAQSAVVGARSFVRFGGNRMDILSGSGAYIPAPSYYVNFSTDEHLGTNSLAGANFDATWSFAGDANAISSLHFRYDAINKTYLAFEQHLSGPKAYAVFSLNPITRANKFWDLLLSDQPSDRLQFKTFTQLNTTQHGLSQPSHAGEFTTLQGTYAMTQSFFQLNAQTTNYSLLNTQGPAPNGYPQQTHPLALDLSATTFEHRIGHTPLMERLSYGFGFTHNAYGLQTIGGQSYPTIWQHNVDALLFVPSFSLGHSYIEKDNYYVNLSVEKNRTWNSSPHFVDTTTSNATISKMFARHFVAFAGYGVQNVSDVYASAALQSAFYPGFTPVVNGVPYPGYAAFRGSATFRTLSLNVNYSNNGNFSGFVLLRKHDDFPAPYPGLAPQFPTDVLGEQVIPPYYLGEPPYDLTADARFRVNDTTTIDLERSYYFNFAGRRWSPEFVIQVAP